MPNLQLTGRVVHCYGITLNIDAKDGFLKLLKQASELELELERSLRVKEQIKDKDKRAKEIVKSKTLVSVAAGAK